jgi:hypothetical protein
VIARSPSVRIRRFTVTERYNRYDDSVPILGSAARAAT